MDIYLFPCYTKEKGAIQMTAECRNWQEEFRDVNFIDQRLKTRFFKIMDAFAASPGKSTWAATGSRSSAIFSLVIEMSPKMNYLTAYPEQL